MGLDVFYNNLNDISKRISDLDTIISTSDILNTIGCIKQNMAFTDSLTSKFILSDKVVSKISDTMPLLLTQIAEVERLCNEINKCNGYGDVSAKTSAVNLHYSSIIDIINRLSDNVETLTIETASLAEKTIENQNISIGDTVRFLYEVTSDDLGVPIVIERGVTGRAIDIINQDKIDFPCDGILVSVANRELVVPSDYLIRVADTIADIYKEIEPELEILEFQELIDDIKNTGPKAKKGSVDNLINLVGYIRQINGKEWDEKYIDATKKYIDGGYYSER